MPTRTHKPFYRSRWWMPAFCLFLGALIFGALAIGGSPADGVGGFGVMAALAALFAFGGRSETLRGLGGPGRDERWAAIDLRASAAAGMTALTVCIGAWLFELASGDDGSPYGQIMTVAGVAYVVAVLVFRART